MTKNSKVAMPEHTISAAPAAVKRIQVKRLFGHYTYDLSLPDLANEESIHQLLLLYGDNGSGKTTIVQLLFHLLSRSDRRGHRTFLAQTKFERFCVYFDNGASLSAERGEKSVEGSYQIICTDSSGKELKVSIKPDEDGSVGKDDVDMSELDKVLNMWSAPPLMVYFLSDNRILQSDIFDSREEIPEEFISTHRSTRALQRAFNEGIERMITMTPHKRDLVVEPSLWRAETWIRRQALAASNVGEATISTIYTEIVKRFAHSPSTEMGTQTNSLDHLMSSLSELEQQSASFVELGLSRPIPLRELTAEVQQVDTHRASLLASVLEPYVDSVRARLDALEEMQRRLSIFLEIINAFYRRKTVRITVSDGIEVYDDKGEKLESRWLSSGEKQLMLLLCNVLVATTQPSLFIIDEPELSLNVKWQRNLIDSLLRLTEGSQVQFIMATHSIELLTRHNHAVLRLDDLES
jgi:energy-coupling factor transporter ATP-binding protein EcfA2